MTVKGPSIGRQHDPFAAVLAGIMARDGHVLTVSPLLTHYGPATRGLGAPLRK
jgi:hypothetical protein